MADNKSFIEILYHFSSFQTHYYLRLLFCYFRSVKAAASTTLAKLRIAFMVIVFLLHSKLFDENLHAFFSELHSVCFE